jgi:UDP-glucuronate 4-epimerase
MTLLLTGAAGFIGSQAAMAFLKQGHRVAALDNFSDAYSPECKHRNLIPLLTHPNFELHRADITNGTALQSFVGETRPDTIVHLAARPGVRDSFGEPRSYFENNVTGTINVLESAVQARVRKVVFASSSSVYGNAPAPFQESGPTLPVSPYALSKLTGEELCRLYSRLYGLQIICLRLFTVYGPRQRPDMAIRKFAERMISGTPIDVYGAGDSRRDYTYVDDVLAGLLASVEYNANFEVFNLGGSTPTSLKDMIDTLAARLNVTPIIHRLPSQVGDPDLT